MKRRKNKTVLLSAAAAVSIAATPCASAEGLFGQFTRHLIGSAIKAVGSAAAEGVTAVVKSAVNGGRSEEEIERERYEKQVDAAVAHLPEDQRAAEKARLMAAHGNLEAFVKRMEAQQAAQRSEEGGLLGMAGDIVGEAARDTLATRAMMDRAEAYAYARRDMRDLPDDKLAALAVAAQRNEGERALAKRDNSLIEDMAAATRSTGDARVGLLGGVLANGIKRLFGTAPRPAQAESSPAQAQTEAQAVASAAEIGDARVAAEDALPW